MLGKVAGASERTGKGIEWEHPSPTSERTIFGGGDALVEVYAGALPSSMAIRKLGIEGGAVERDRPGTL